MKTSICEQFGIDFPLFAFSHCRVAVTNAGGFGVLGATAYTPEQLDRELSWIDDQVRDKPYSADIIVPATFEGKGEKLSRGEAGGHCGEVTTMVLIPEVLEAISGMRQVLVLAAGGIVTGRQMAAAVALGAAGSMAGSVWLTTEEAETAPYTVQKLLAAGSRDTVRSAGRTGKSSRQLVSDWTDA